MAEQELRLPKFGMQMTEATVEEWLVSDGEAITQGEEVVVVSTDKAEAAIEAPTTGTVRQVVAVGETVEAGTVLAVIDQV